MNLKINYNIILIIIFSFLYGGASLSNISPNLIDPSEGDLLRHLFVGGSLLAAFFVFLALPKEKQAISFKFSATLYTWIFFSIVVIITSICKYEWSQVVNGFWFLLVFPFVFFYMIPFLVRITSVNLLCLAFVLGHIPYILFSLVLFPITRCHWAYAGIFSNPNSLGLILAISVSGLSYFLYITQSEKRLKIATALFILIIFFVYLIFLTGSRTSLLAVLFVIVVLNFLCKMKFFYKLLNL